ncbi:molybdenum cofactor biosynthesis A domain protein [Burkholderia pseudomallei MSHR5609]|nr:molybdenum cofactor biosynthesis A domain protein [Burkholderia pseudomallei MSHR5609]
MNARSSRCARAKRTRSSTSSSLRPRRITQFSLMRRNPARFAAAMPAGTSRRRPVRVNVPKRSSRRLSRLMLTRARPAAFNGAANCARRAPLVVRASSSSPGRRAMRSTSVVKPGRTSGSPPVSRIRRTPSASSVSTSERGGNRMSCAMRYTQRKSHRSVTDRRTYVTARPKRSTSARAIDARGAGSPPARGSPRRAPGSERGGITRLTRRCGPTGRACPARRPTPRDREAPVSCR